MSMKIKYIALCLLLVLVGCQRDEEMEIGQVSVSNERLEASYSSVEISCSFQTNVTIKNVQAYLSTEADFSSAKSYSLSEKEKNTFGATIEGLKDASTYYVRYEVSNRWSSKMIDEVSEFKTIPYTIPMVQTSEVSEVTHSTAIVGGVITENGGQEITERGVVYSKSPNPSIENGTKIESLEKTESYACTLMDLEYVTTYYVRAYAINEKGVAYGEERRLRKVGLGEDISYYYSVFRVGAGGKKTIVSEKKVERSIYESLLEFRDKDRDDIVKKRYYFVSEGEYLHLDIFSGDNEVGMLEINVNRGGRTHIPDELRVIDIVSGDSAYSNRNLAKKGDVASMVKKYD